MTTYVSRLLSLSRTPGLSSLVGVGKHGLVTSKRISSVIYPCPLSSSHFASYYSSSSGEDDGSDENDDGPKEKDPKNRKNDVISRSRSEVTESSSKQLARLDAAMSRQHPMMETKRLLSLPFPEEVVVFPIWEKPYVPMTTGQHILSDSPFLRHLLKITQVDRDGRVGMFVVNNPDVQDPIVGVDQIKQVGVLGGIVNIQKIPGKEGETPGAGKFAIFLAGLRRIKIQSVVPGRELLTVNVRPLETLPCDKGDITIRALVNEVTNTIYEILRTELNPLYRQHLENLTTQINPNDPGELADLAAAFSSAGRDELQTVLEELNVEKRLAFALELLRKELEVNKFQMRIQKQLEEKMSASQRRFMMMEQLKLIKKELGMEKDDKEALLQKFQERIGELDIPKEALTVINDEMAKISTLEPSSSEYNVTRNYLDWLTLLPWGKYSEDVLDLDRARKVLEDEHYGLEDIKDVILEFIAVGKLRGGVRGKIYCFVGPPGVGKTSIGKSIANALDRKFYRFSVGGLSDVAEIKGHRRTYVGAMPGKLLQCLKSVKTSNPVIMIDEIDKMQRGYQGDPASALLEVLDPEQNNSFRDHYLDVPYDLSNVLFLCTANVIDTIPKPLQDRMEIVRLSGYVTEEKVKIAKKYLIPAAQKELGLKKKNFTFRESAIRQLISKYCREAGVRNLQKHIEKILRKVAYKIVSDPENTKITIMDKNLDDFVGKAIFNSDRYYDHPPAGVVMGLSWTSMGGATLYIETTVEPSSKGELLRTTGQMGNVMKESTDIAYTYARIFYNEVQQDKKYKDLVRDPDFFLKNTIHMHVPEGATPKDGPSAGITMTTSLLSLAMNKAIRSDVAMTGELTLTGKVLSIGGVKEKTIAAKRSGITHIIFPYDNRKDFEELPDFIREGLTAHYAKTYRDVFKIAFGLEEVKTPPTTPKKSKGEEKEEEQAEESIEEALEDVESKA